MIWGSVQGYSSDTEKSSLLISWVKATDNFNSQEFLRYSVYRATLSNFSDQQEIMSWTTDVDCYIDSDLSPGNTYFYRVDVKDLRDNPSSYTVKAYQATLNLSPDVGAGDISISGISDFGFDLSWQKATDDTTSQELLEYRLLISDQSISQGTIIDAKSSDLALDWAADQDSYSASNLEYNTTYYVGLAVRDSHGVVSFYQIKEVTTLDDLVAPIALTILDPTDVEFSSLLLRWNKASDNRTAEQSLRYEISLNNPSNPDFSYSDSLLGDNSLLVEGLSPGTVYNFDLTVYDLAGNSSSYPSRLISTLVDEEVPTIENGILNIYDIEAESFSLSWIEATDNFTSQSDLRYKLVVTSDSLTERQVIQAAGSVVKLDWIDGISEFSVDSLYMGSTYNVYLAVKDSSDNQAFYQASSVELLIDNSVPVPGNNGWGKLISHSNYNIVLQWEAATDENCDQSQLMYKVVFKSGSNFKIESIAEAQALPQSNILMDWTQNRFNVSKGDCLGRTEFAFVILVKNTQGNISMYSPLYKPVLYSGDAFIGGGFTKNCGPYLLWDATPTTTMTINYVTEKADTPATLYFGPSEDNMIYEIIKPSHNDEIYHTRFIGLEPMTSYFYKLSINTSSKINSSGDYYTANTVLETKTAPESEEGMGFIVLGDMQPKDAGTVKMNNVVAQGIRQRIDSEDVIFVAQLGDVTDTAESSDRWQDTLGSFPIFASRVPMHASIGNHDGGMAFRNQTWRMRNVLSYNYASSDEANMYYSFDVGKAHFIFIDSKGSKPSYPMNIGEDQINWLKADLETAKAKDQKWIFVFFHLAMLCNGADTDSRYYDDLQQKLIPIFAHYSIDAAFWGHDHLYEHWQYYYGQNGHVYPADSKRNNQAYIADLEDREYPIRFFEAGTGGAVSEMTWDMWGSEKEEKIWYNTANGQLVDISTAQKGWNKNKYFQREEKACFIDANFSNSEWDDAGYRNTTIYGMLNGFHYHFPFKTDGSGNVERDADGQMVYDTGNYSTSYSDDNSWFGYQYGEVAPSYIYVKFLTNGNVRISTHYPDGSILGDRPGVLPPEAKQEFEFPPKNRRYF
ncbi:MAG: metallophosphoesterase [Spirochaetales bacterium]|nr:metallophosphoesterase [Spirochaetales bacterium]